MHLGYVLRYWPTVSETFVAREVEGLVRRGHRVDVVGMGRRKDAAYAPASPAHALYPPSGYSGGALLWPLRALSRAEVRPVVRWAQRTMRPRDLARALWVADQGARLGWDRIHVHFAGEAAEWARVAAHVLSIPYTVTVHAVDLFVPRPSLDSVLQGAERVITVSAYHRRWLALHHGIDAVVVRCGVPTEVPLASPGGTDGPVRFVCVARDVPKKGLDALVDGILELPSANLRLVSDAVRLGGPRVLAYPLPPGKVPEVLARAQVFALPCRVAPDGDSDGLPVSLLEAMAAGLPVVSTAVAGIPEVLDEDVGWIVPPDDAPALHRALLQAACDPSARDARGRAGRERILAEQWTVSRQVDGLLAAWGISV